MQDDVIERLLGHSKIMERDKGKFVRFIDVATCAEAVDLIAALTAERDAAVAEVAQIVAWLRNNMPITTADLTYEADAIEAGAHKR